MRELYIQFSNDGQNIRDIDNEKRYFLFEAEEILYKLHSDFRKNGRDGGEKKFNLFIEEEHILTAFCNISDGKSLESIIKNAITTTDAWDEENKNKYLNFINNYIQQEKELFLVETFYAFSKNLEEYLKKIPFSFSLEQHKAIFETFSSKITEGLFSEIDSICSKIYDCLTNEAKYRHLEEKTIFNEWFSNADNFKKWLLFSSTYYFSFSISRISTIRLDVHAYQTLQDYLFNIFESDDFNESLKWNEKIDQRFVDKWIDLNRNGIILDTEEKVKVSVIEPVVNEFFTEELERTTSSLSQEYILNLGYVVKQRKETMPKVEIVKVQEETLKASTIENEEENIKGDTPSATLNEGDTELQDDSFMPFSQMLKWYKESGVDPFFIPYFHGYKDEYLIDEVKIIIEALANQEISEEQKERFETKKLFDLYSDEILSFILCEMEIEQTKNQLFNAYVIEKDNKQFEWWALIEYVSFNAKKLIRGS